MKLIPSLVCSLLALSPLAYSASQTQVFPTAAGPVSITPLNHASTLIEAGGKVIYIDPFFDDWPSRQTPSLLTPDEARHADLVDVGGQAYQDKIIGFLSRETTVQRMAA